MLDLVGNPEECISRVAAHPENLGLHMQISCAVTSKLISAIVYTSWI